ncbi:hypothetical protein E5Z46_01980 [Geobacillus kaustophilus NBRC 102445]|uniref:sulfotransferase family 2 domain-containing protein n=1 Tax=Geobacillus thermoleovorans group TaxID=1505648 RepID=UPI0005AB77B6|nr:sulfotransferase family 2 domain-containing protein [Geobacillus kaustophilus]MED4974760.1 sulfotransferase family 2 domain-containing protein [Geobacillus thermoleovorans]QCK81234.1 hypothetical protein E5Z46_01980 [Geobacillus kaustophilus NBRC 102445]
MVKKWIKNKLRPYPNLYRLLKLIYHFFTEMKNLLLYGRVEKREFIILDDKELVYLNNSKVACSSIKKTFTSKEVQDDYSIHILNWNRKARLSEKEKKYFKFTFVRNPFDRLVSCYSSKYHKDKEKGKDILDFDIYLLGILRKDKGFENFVKRVVKIPDFLADRHFQSQYNLIYDKRGKCLVDYVGKFENINEEFKEIQKKFQLAPLPHFNKSDKNDWRDYYTIETANLVYKKYRKDIETFGYEEEYKNLIKYLKEKEEKASNQ